MYETFTRQLVRRQGWYSSMFLALSVKFCQCLKCKIKYWLVKFSEIFDNLNQTNDFLGIFEMNPSAGVGLKEFSRKSK